MACWFAHRFVFNGKAPIVVTTTVSADQIIFYDNERGEHEVITSVRPRADVDPDPSSWADAAAAFRAWATESVSVGQLLQKLTP